MYLHEDIEKFKQVLKMVSDYSGKEEAFIEKDYYITLILRRLAEQMDKVVFKGGTSLSKGFHAIDRFSEDIDITFVEHIGESRRKKLKNNILLGISDELGMNIVNFDKTQSDRDYNAYHFAYNSVVEIEDDRLLQFVKLETALGSYAFPTTKCSLDNYIGSFLANQNLSEEAVSYHLDPFMMNLQSLERTYIDKVFALCDYYLQGKVKRYSRHLYDIYKLTPLIRFDSEFSKLVAEVREHRSKMEICPSARQGVDIKSVVSAFCNENYYKSDYQMITEYLSDDKISYDDAICTMLDLMEKNIF